MITKITDNCLENLNKILKHSITIYLTFMLCLCIYLTDFTSHKYQISPDHPCLNIENVISDGDHIHITFKKEVQPHNPLALSGIFGYFTSAFDNPLLMPPGSAFKATITRSSHTLSLSFPIPFIANYTGTFFCVDDQIYKEPPFQLPEYKNTTGVIYEKKLNMSIPTFRNSTDLDDTQMLCHGKNSESRWCEVRHIGMAHGKFVMQTKAHFLFPTAFLSLGGRAPPFDNTGERLSNEPLLTKRNIAEMSVGVIANDEIAVLAAPCNDRHSIFEIIFDFLIPAYQTLKKLKLSSFYISKNSNILYDKKKIRFFFHDAFDRTNIELIQAITKEPPNSLPSFDSLMIFEHVVLGLEKGDEDCDATRSEYAKYGHIYNFNRENTRGFRESILESFNIEFGKENLNQNNVIKKNKDLKKRKNKAIVTFLAAEKSEIYKIFNLEALKRLVTKSCPFCEVNTFLIETDNISSFLEMASRSAVLIGRSGTGLEHAVWMQPNSHVVEIRPYKFACDDRYEVAAKISGSHYHTVMNTNKFRVPLNEMDKETRLQNCFSAPAFCESLFCYKPLLEQKVDVEMDIFNTTWNIILEHLKKSFE